MRLLVVEDDVALAAGLRDGLTAEGFAVDVARTGPEGLWLASENPYAAIVLDVMLPELNGYQVCASLREAGVWTPILMLTAKDGELDEAEALDTGADDFLTKPVSQVVLLARLRALVRRGAAARPTALEVGDLRLDPAARRLWRGDVEIDATPREIALMELLMRRAGQTLSKLEILDQVWEGEFEGDPNIVEVYVARLRRKLDRPFGRASLTTVRGSGYRLEADSE